MPLYPKVILTAQHVHEVTSPAAYLALVARSMREGRAARPSLIWPEPWSSPDKPAVYINDGTWKVRCTTPECYNALAVHPDWRLACCLECAAVYEGLVIPAEAKEICAALLARPEKRTRNWTSDVTVEALWLENKEHGVAA